MPITPWNPGGYFPFRYGTIPPTTGPGAINPTSGGVAAAPTNPSSVYQTDPNTGISTLPASWWASHPAQPGPPGNIAIPGLASGSGPTSGSDVTGQSLSNNLGNAPSLESLTNLINQLNIEGQQGANAARIPGATGLEAASSANIGNELAGLMDPADKTLLAQAAAERGVQFGFPGSPNVDSNFLANYFGGIENLKQLGQQNLSAAYARNPVAKLFDPTTQLITPYQQGELNNQANQLALEWYRTLHPQFSGTGGQRGGGQQPQPTNAPDMSWFQRALQSAGGLNQPIGVAPVNLPPPTTYLGTPDDPNYPGTSVPGLPPLTSILGTPDPGYGLSPDPYGQPPYTPDASNPDYWNFSGDNSGLGDAFSLYGGE